MGSIEPKSDFIFEKISVPTKNIVLLVHLLDSLPLDVWMPRVVTDALTPQMREGLIEAITDFLRHVPVRRQ